MNRANILAILAAAMLVAPAAAQDDAQATPQQRTPDQAQAWADQAARLAVAEAQSYDIRLGDSTGPQLKLADRPVLKWSNTHDGTIHGSVLVWMHEGRPAAITSIFKYFTVKDEFSAELHSLAEGPLVAVKDGQAVWQPAEAGVVFSALADSPAPAGSAAGRLSQMRGLARAFSGTMTTFDQTTDQLRLLPQPLVRYAGDEQHPVDGAVFAFARATDPDVLLLLEARAASGKDLKWHYALARMHCGALSMNHRAKEIWSVEQMAYPFARPQGAYTLLQDLPEPNLTAEP
jgi:hypothetical protein